MNKKYLLTQVGKLSVSTDDLDKPAFVYINLSEDISPASHSSASLQIPAGVWDEIRRNSAATFDLADVTDEELRVKALQCIAQWNGLKRLLKPYPDVYKTLLGMKRAYDLATDYRAYFRALRARRSAQRKLREALGRLRFKAVSKPKNTNQPKRRKRVLLPEFKRHMAQRPREGQKNNQHGPR